MKELEDLAEKALQMLGIKKSKWIKIVHGLSTSIPVLEQITDLFNGNACCEKCNNLVGRCFRSNNMPQLPIHPKCHCSTKNIDNLVPNLTAFATCELSKFAGYIFSEKGDENGKKELFEGWGYDIMDSQWLQQEFERQAVEKYCSGAYSLGKLDNYGQRISIVIELPRKNGQGNVTFISGWMVYKDGKISLTTPYGGRL